MNGKPSKRNAEDYASNDGSGLNYASFDAGLPSSLPSFAPDQDQSPAYRTGDRSQPPPSFLPSAGLTDLIENDISGSSKRQAPVGQWKTPPQFLYTARDPNAPAIPMPQVAGAPSTAAAALDALSFQDMPVPPGSSASVVTGSTASGEGGSITAEQFASSTGLALDTSIIAKMNGKAESELTMDHIKSIMNRPDMLSIYQKMQEEDERRRKRLARNRNSARARRLKKKNMVEAYETEVSHLEMTLKKLGNHQWGSGQADTLVELLGEPQQFSRLSIEKRRAYVAALLRKCSASTASVCGFLLMNFDLPGL